jgi:hypothetical protein
MSGEDIFYVTSMCNFPLSNLVGSNLDVEEMLFEIWCSKTKTLLGELSVPIAGHRDTPMKFAKEHWYYRMMFWVYHFSISHIPLPP